MSFDFLINQIRDNDFLDLKLRFIIKDKSIYCSKILFRIQSNYPLNGDEITIEYQNATVELVRIFANWIDSRDKKLPELDIKSYLILAQLANSYNVEVLSDQIYTILKEIDAESHKILSDLLKNIDYTFLNEKSKKVIIDNLDLFLSYDQRAFISKYSPYLSFLRNFKYKDKVDILTTAIKAGKKPSLLSSLYLFTSDELSSNDINTDLAPLFQLSKKGFLFYLCFVQNNLHNSNAPLTKKDSDDIDSVKMSNDLDNLKKEYNDLKSKSEKLFEDIDKKSKEFSSFDEAYQKIQSGLKLLDESSKEQEKNISEIRKNYDQDKYEDIKKYDSQVKEHKKKIQYISNSYSNFANKLSYENNFNYISSKIFLNNLSYRFVNDSESIVLTTDAIQNEHELTSAINFSSFLSSTNDKSTDSIICKIDDETRIFSPIYFELGFCSQPLNYSWEIFAKFKPFGQNYIHNLYEISNDDNNNRSNKANDNDKAEDIDSPNNVWIPITKHEFDDKIPQPDDSYNPEWDDLFILQFKFPPGFFPQSIKLQLNSVKNSCDKNIKKCFNHFRVIGIQNFLKKQEQKNP